MTDAEVVVEGARFVFDGTGAIRGSARIPAERPVVLVTFPDSPRAAWTQDGPARLVRGDLSAEVRSDSVLILRAARAAPVRAETLFRPVYDESARGRRLALDEDGGLGVFPTRPGMPRSGAYELRPDDELWISVCPPRRPSPRREAQEIAHEGRPRPFPDGAYPSTAIVEDAARHCQVFALHAYFWESGPRRIDLAAGRYALRRRPWTTARHVPADPERFARLAGDVRRAGMEFVVYLSPRHSTAPDLFAEMRRVLDEYPVDGLYLDGVSHDFRANDAVVRGAREVLGPDRILYLNASDEPFGTPRVRCPFIESHADFVLRGDAGRGGLPLERFLRFAVSGRNIGNAVGIWCHYGSSGRAIPADRAPSARHVEAARRHGVRLWRRSLWDRGLADFDLAYGGRRGGATEVPQGPARD
jgi:hypothetical protein